MQYRLSEIAAICGGRLEGRDGEVSRVIIDSRSFQGSGSASGVRGGNAAGSVDGVRGGNMAGDEVLFVAIRTAQRDGADYVGDLYRRGVRGFVVGEDFFGASAGSDVGEVAGSGAADTGSGSGSSVAGVGEGSGKGSVGYGKGAGAVAGSDAGAAQFEEAGFVVVKDTVKALQALAAHYRKGFRGKVVGITGSYGKTTVKEWIAQLVPDGVSLFRSPGSYNSQIGVPLAVLMASGDEDYVVIEAGISKPGEMAVLQRIVRPDVGILTSVGGAHIENFESVGQLRDEKNALFGECADVIRATGAGSGSGGADTGSGSGLGTDGVHALTPDDISKRNADLAMEFWRHEGYGVPEEKVAALEPVAMRLEVKEGLHDSVIILDTYASDINSLGIALDHLTRVAAGRERMVIVAESEEALKLIKSAGIEHYVGIGVGRSVDDLLGSITSADISGRAILIKGGARMGFDRIGYALERKSHTTVLEVDLDALVGNLRLCRSRLAPGVGVMPMVKASGYGHGTFEVARTLQGQGVDYLAVAFADEGVALREGGITMPIVVLNADEGSFETMIRRRLEPEIYNFTSLDNFVALLKRHGEKDYPIHIKLDTGMHRLGFVPREMERLTGALARAGRYVRVATIFSHLAAADDPAQDAFTRGQIALFSRMSSQIAEALPYPVKRHIANTNGIERFPEAHFDMVRLGLGLYGMGMEGAKEISSLKTRIVNISELEAGETVGYGRCGVLKRPSRVATIPIGYADGLSRRLSCGGWSMLVGEVGVGGFGGGVGSGGVAAPIVGNVCMDSCMIDVTDAKGAAVGDTVVVFSPVAGNTVGDMARVLGTIPYEVMTGVSARVKRVYVKE